MTLNAASVPDPLRPHICLFNTEAYHALRREVCVREYGLGEMGRIVGVQREGDFGVFASGDRAPFGGFDWSSDRVTPEQVDEGIALFAIWLDVMDARVHLKPPHYSPQTAAEMVALLRHGFRITRADLNSYIEIPETLDEYSLGLKHESRVALARTIPMFDSKTLNLDDDEGWACAYDLLVANRAAKGRAMSFDLDYLLRLRDAFGELVTMIVVVDEEQWRAVALVYRVGRGRSMVQNWGHLAGIPGRSPMNVLAREVVRHSIDTGARTLDLGISSSAGVIDGNLARFKRSVGARSEVRYVVSR